MKNKKYIYILIAILILLIVGVSWFLYKNTDVDLSSYVDGDKNVQSTTLRSEVEVYEHDSPVFSFEYPTSFSTASFPEGLGEVVLVQSKENSAVGMQIYVEPFDEEGHLTIERIREDLPDLVMKRAREADLFTDTQAIVFLDSSDMVNVWFVREGYLYQITAAPELGGLFQTMVGSLKLN